MKKTLHGLIFDTDRAIKIGSYTTPFNPDDFNYWSASLYKTQSSERYFLAGSGMQMTRFGARNGKHVWTTGPDIIPITRETAIEWAKKYLKKDVFSAEFP